MAILKGLREKSRSVVLFGKQYVTVSCVYEMVVGVKGINLLTTSQDNNMGLVSQLVLAFDKFIILKLGRTFSALKMSDVAWRRFSTGQLCPGQVEAYVASLVMSGLINALLFHLRDNSDSTMLRFASPSGQSLFWERDLRKKLERTGYLAKAIANSIDHGRASLGFSNEFFQFSHKNQRYADTPTRVAFAPEHEGDQVYGDEDIMEDLH